MSTQEGIAVLIMRSSVLRIRSNAAESAQYLYGSSAAQPTDHNDWRKIAFYNIGWRSGDKKHTTDDLAKDINYLVATKPLDAIGISEVLNLRDDHLHERREIIMQPLLVARNDKAAQPAWEGRCDGHYIFLWNTSTLHPKMYEFIGCDIREHPWRRAQYMQSIYPNLQNRPPLHLIHCHSPVNPNLSDDRKKASFLIFLTNFSF